MNPIDILLNALRSIPAPSRIAVLAIAFVAAVVVSVLRHFGIQSGAIDQTLGWILAYVALQSVVNVHDVPETEPELDTHDEHPVSGNEGAAV